MQRLSAGAIFTWIITAAATGCLVGGTKQVQGASFTLSPVDFALANVLDGEVAAAGPEAACQQWRSKAQAAAQMQGEHESLKRWVDAKEQQACAASAAPAAQRAAEGPVPAAPAQPTPPAPVAEPAPEPLAGPLDPGRIDAALAAIRAPSAGARAATSLLLRLGFSKGDLGAVDTAKLVAAERLQKNLDGDADIETVVHIHYEGTARDTDEQINRTTELHYVAFLDVHGGQLAPVGARLFTTSSCVAMGSFRISFQPIHAKGLDDVLVRLFDAPQCSGWKIGEAGTTTVLTLERGKLEAILEEQSYSESERQTGNRLVEGLDVVFAGAPPQVARLVEGKKKTKKTLKFDPTAFRFR
jgi:hypothetical protein